MKFYSTLLVFLLVGFYSCQKSASGDIEPPTSVDITPVTVTWVPSGINTSALFDNRFSIAALTYIDENSGLDVSAANAGYLWGHDDSGNIPYLYLINKKTGALAARFLIDGISNIDFEDIAVGPGPVAGKSYIYFGDIGDNFKFRPNVIVYRFEEPLLPSTIPSDGIVKLTIPFDKINLKYPGGARDAETLMVDPANKNIVIVSKSGSNVSMYVSQYPQPTSGVSELKLAINLPFTTAVAGDVSADGKEIVIKTYEDVYYWKNDSREALQVALTKTPERIPYIAEPQGEAVCIDSDGLYTLSEKASGITPELFFYRRK